VSESPAALDITVKLPLDFEDTEGVPVGYVADCFVKKTMEEVFARVFVIVMGLLPLKINVPMGTLEPLLNDISPVTSKEPVTIRDPTSSMMKSPPVIEKEPVISKAIEESPVISSGPSIVVDPETAREPDTIMLANVTLSAKSSDVIVPSCI
jgi:hypothetical protein